MSVYNYILAYLSGAMTVFGCYYLFQLIFVHKKIIWKQFYFICFCLIGSCYQLFELMLSLNFSPEQYLLIHKLKMLCAMLLMPVVILINFKTYFPQGKLTIIYIAAAITPILIVFIPFNSFTSLPINKIVIATTISDFIYNLPTTNIVYKIWGGSLMLCAIYSLFYFIFSRAKEKRSTFIVLILIIILVPMNDLLVSSRIIYNIYLTEYGFFALIVMLFIEFLNEDRNTYLTVVNLSKELMKSKEELEIKVENRTHELKIEKEKSEQLLLNVLPDQIAERLKQGEQPIADHFDEASVVFIDIADFTKISAKSTPQKMVNMLNNVFTEFDKIALKHGLEKIKTIGDCYMAAAGIPEHRADHAEAIAMMAIEALETMEGYKTEDGHDIKFRIGLDCGPIVAGVIGKQKFIYDLWGDMVNTASRMEENGIIGRIQCTERFVKKLGQRAESLGVIIEERGEIEIKGKGKMKTYFIK